MNEPATTKTGRRTRVSRLAGDAKAYYEHIGTILKERREELEVSQEWVAQRMGMPRTIYNKVERGRQAIPAYQFAKLCAVLAIKPTWLPTVKLP